MAAPPRSPAHIAAELARLKDANLDDRDRLSLLHEISVYREGLLVQTEALMHAQSVLQATRDRFIELYDFAPNGYLTLDQHGIVGQCNLTAAAFLGRSRTAIEGSPLLAFVTVESRPRYFEFLRQCRSGRHADVEAEVTLTSRDGMKEAQLLCRPHAGPDSAPLFFTAIVDITEKKMLERERARTADERSALANRLLAAIDDERQRIAQDLHDDVGQQLTAIRLKVERIIRTSAANADQDMHTVQHMIAQLDQRLHLIATELRPAALDLGLVTAAGQFVRGWREACHIPVEFTAQGIADGDVSPDVGIQLYRILQEALNNVAKHAAARHVFVLLDKRVNDVLLLVKDDGRGFTVADTRPPQAASLGLVGMRERAHMIGGRMQIESAPSEGTSLFVFVPVDGRVVSR